MEQTISKNQRDSNFELLRIFAMFMIILHHLSQHGVWFSPDSPITSNFLIQNFVFYWPGQLGNCLFALLTGYFISKSQFTIKKALKIWFEIFSISVIIGLILYFTKIPLIGFYNGDYSSLGFFDAAKPASKADLIRSLLPNFYGNNWYATTYLLFYFFTPFLNESLKVLDQKKHLYLIALMTITGTVIYMIYGQNFINEGNLFYFILAYYLGSYIRIYDPKYLKNQILNIILSIFFICCFILWIYLVIMFKDKITFIQTHYDQVLVYPFASINRFPVLFTSIFVFSFFKNLKIKNNKIINTISGTTLGIYLIHENLLLNKIIWHRIFKFDNFKNSPLLFLYMLFASIITLLVCSLIELIRQNILEKPLFNLIFKQKKNPSQNS